MKTRMTLDKRRTVMARPLPLVTQDRKDSGFLAISCISLMRRQV